SIFNPLDKSIRHIRSVWIFRNSKYRYVGQAFDPELIAEYLKGFAPSHPEPINNGRPLSVHHTLERTSHIGAVFLWRPLQREQNAIRFKQLAQALDGSLAEGRK